MFNNDAVTVIAEPEVWRKVGGFSASDDSPAAKAAGRADFEAGSALAEKAFYGFGYYVGKISGALVGSLTLSVRVDGTVNAVINPDTGPALTLAGQFDTASIGPVRVLTLSGGSKLGALTLDGKIDLKDRTVQGNWAATATGANPPSAGGSFLAHR